jgi:osmotically-inducible protein OsmY
MANWNERDQDWRGAQGWGHERGGARGSFGEQRYRQGNTPGYNAGGGQGDFGRDDQRNYGRSSYGQGGYGQGGHDASRGGYDEDRSWQAEGGSDFRYEDGFNPAGPLHRGQGGEGRYGGQRYGREGRSGQDDGYDRGASAYGVEWSDRDSYDARRSDRGGGSRGGGEYLGDYGGRRYGGESDGGRYQRGGQSGLSTLRDTGFGDPNPYVQAATDGERQGAHRGRGPSDYRRSDDRVCEDINDRLTDDPHIDASGIKVQVKDGEVTLSGTVDSRFAKRHAEDLAEGISGARHVQNNLRVRDSNSRSDSSSYGSSASQGDTTTAGATNTTTSSTASGRA